MRCSTCQTENPLDSSFCEACGAALEIVCLSCGAAARANTKFCRKCGAAVVAESQKRKVESPHPSTGALANRLTGSPASYTPKHLADKILTSRAALEACPELVEGASANRSLCCSPT